MSFFHKESLNFFSTCTDSKLERRKKSFLCFFPKVLKRNDRYKSKKKTLNQGGVANPEIIQRLTQQQSCGKNFGTGQGRPSSTP
jgi:hypothetical protein